MDIPFNILVMYLAFASMIGVLGIILGIKKIAGSPFIIMFAGIMIFALLAITNDVTGDGLTGVENQEIIQNTTVHMNQVTATISESLRAGANIMTGEEVANENSILAYDRINQVKVEIIKTGFPSGDFYVGVWNSIQPPTVSNAKFIIGQMKANYTGAQNNYVFTRNDTKTYVLQPFDIVGVFYNGGDASNRIAIRYNATANSFDNSDSQKSTFSSATQVWTDSSTQDLKLRVALVENNAKITEEPYDFNNSDVWVFIIILGGFFFLIGISIQLQKW